MIELDEKLTVIVCPKSVVDTWENHIKTYYPEYQVFKCKVPEELLNKNVIIVNYDLIWRRAEFKQLKDYTLILDESQFIKNSTATRTKFIMKLNFKNLILLSGTPTRRKIRRTINTMPLVRLEDYKNSILEYVYRLHIDTYKWI